VCGRPNPALTGGVFGFRSRRIEAIVFRREHRPIALRHIAFDQFAILFQSLVRKIGLVIAAHAHGPEIQIRELRHRRCFALGLKREQRGGELRRCQRSVFLRSCRIERLADLFEVVVVAL
jgi:hypothetical protein